MISKRRFPNFVDMGPEFWTEHEVNSIEDIHNIEWIQRWIHNNTPLAYSKNNPYLNPTKYPYGLIGTLVDEVGGKSYITIGVFTEDPSHFGIPLHTKNEFEKKVV